MSVSKMSQSFPNISTQLKLYIIEAPLLILGSKTVFRLFRVCKVYLTYRHVHAHRRQWARQWRACVHHCNLRVITRARVSRPSGGVTATWTARPARTRRGARRWEQHVLPAGMTWCGVDPRDSVMSSTPQPQNSGRRAADYDVPRAESVFHESGSATETMIVETFGTKQAVVSATLN